MDDKVKLVQKLVDYYPKNLCELEHNSVYELLVAVILSAQCTDKRVNVVTRELFKVASTPEQMLKLGMDNLKEIIKPCGFYNAKAKSIIEASTMIVNQYGGVVPQNRQDLIKLRGVGEKVASVVLAVGYNEPAIAVDTHVFRLSKRLGLADEPTPTKTMHALEHLLPKDMWRDAHFAIVLHGRNFCKAINPRCKECFIKDECPKLNLKK